MTATNSSEQGCLILATDIWLNAFAATAGLRTDLDLIRFGLRGLEVPPSATISDCWEQINADYLSGELEKRLARTRATPCEG